MLNRALIRSVKKDMEFANRVDATKSDREFRKKFRDSILESAQGHGQGEEQKEES